MSKCHQKPLLLVLLSLISLLPAGCVTFGQIEIEPIKMTIVDSVTGDPLPGVLAVYHLESEEGTLTGHGGRHAQLAIFEVLTDQEGVLYIPPQKVRPRPFWNYRNPFIYLFKSGYESAFIGNARHIIPKLSDVLGWEKNGATIKLKKPESFEKYIQRIDSFKYALEHLYDEPSTDSCGWKKVPRAIMALEQEAMSFETSGKRKHNSTILRNLIGNEAFSGKKYGIVSHCGSPNEFFQAYSIPCPDGSTMMTKVKRRSQVDEISHVGTSIILYTVGYCPTDQKYWLYKAGEGWYVRDDLSLIFPQDKRLSEYCEAIVKSEKGGSQAVGALTPDKEACSGHCRKYCREQCNCLYGGKQLNFY